MSYPRRRVSRNNKALLNMDLRDGLRPPKDDSKEKKKTPKFCNKGVLKKRKNFNQTHTARRRRGRRDRRRSRPRRKSKRTRPTRRRNYRCHTRSKKTCFGQSRCICLHSHPYSHNRNLMHGLRWFLLSGYHHLTHTNCSHSTNPS